jgi:hypothetical protein
MGCSAIPAGPVLGPQFSCHVVCSAIPAGPDKALSLAVMGCSDILARPVLGPQFSFHGVYSHTCCASFRPSVYLSLGVQPYQLGQF